MAKEFQLQQTAEEIQTAVTRALNYDSKIFAASSKDANGNTVLTVPEGTVIGEGTILCFEAVTKSTDGDYQSIVINENSYMLARVSGNTTFGTMNTYFTPGDVLTIRIMHVDDGYAAYVVAALIGVMFSDNYISADRITSGTVFATMTAEAYAQNASNSCFRNTKIVTAEENPDKSGSMVWVCG